MRHLTDEELVLHYYSEEGETLETERHLEACPACRAVYAGLQSALNILDAAPLPDRGPEYGAEVWQRVAPQLPVPSWWRRWVFDRPVLHWAFSGAVLASLLTTAFLAGRFYPRPPAPAPVASDAQLRERVLLLAVGDYLDRSQMVLVELANTNARGPLDISLEQERARDLVSETRLYRQTAAATGDASVTGILDELERVLLDIARGPSRLSPAELEKFRARLEAEGILFKIRVVNSNVRGRDETPAGETSRKNL